MNIVLRTKRNARSDLLGMNPSSRFPIPLSIAHSNINPMNSWRRLVTWDSMGPMVAVDMPTNITVGWKIFDRIFLNSINWAGSIIEPGLLSFKWLYTIRIRNYSLRSFYWQNSCPPVVSMFNLVLNRSPSKVDLSRCKDCFFLSLWFSCSNLVSTDLQYPLFDPSDLHDECPDSIDVSIKDEVFPWILVVHRSGNHRMFLGRCGHVCVEVSRIDTHRRSLRSDQRLRLSEFTSGYLRSRHADISLGFLLLFRYDQIPSSVSIRSTIVTVQRNDSSCSKRSLFLRLDVFVGLRGFPRVVLSLIRLGYSILCQSFEHGADALRNDAVEIRCRRINRGSVISRTVLLLFVHLPDGLRVHEHVRHHHQRQLSSRSKQSPWSPSKERYSNLVIHLRNIPLLDRFVICRRCSLVDGSSHLGVKRKSQLSRANERERMEYVNTIDYFPEKIDQLLDALQRVRSRMSRRQTLLRCLVTPEPRLWTCCPSWKEHSQLIISLLWFSHQSWWNSIDFQQEIRW